MSIAHTISDDEYGHARRALEGLRELPENWDGAGAPRVSKLAIDRAWSVLSDLWRGSTIPAPRIAAMADGGVQLTWVLTTKKGRLEIEARLTDDGDNLMIGYTHRPGFEFNKRLDAVYEIPKYVRERFEAERT